MNYNTLYRLYSTTNKKEKQKSYTELLNEADNNDKLFSIRNLKHAMAKAVWLYKEPAPDFVNIDYYFQVVFDRKKIADNYPDPEDFVYDELKKLLGLSSLTYAIKKWENADFKVDIVANLSETSIESVIKGFLTNKKRPNFRYGITVCILGKTKQKLDKKVVENAIYEVSKFIDTDVLHDSIYWKISKH